MIMTKNSHLAAFAFLAVTCAAAPMFGGCAAPAIESEDMEQVAEAEDEMRSETVNVDYYAEPELINFVGWKTYGCFSTASGGQRTAYADVYSVASCIYPYNSSSSDVGCYWFGSCSPEFDYCVQC
jgi:hypothetical protein